MRRILFLLLLVCSSAKAATYYISTTGSDGAAGSIGAPWATYAHANSTATSGDTVLVNPGIYDQRPAMTTAGITWRAIQPVTNLSTFTIVNSNIVVDGFEWTARSATMGGDGHEAIWINGTNAPLTGIQIVNNKAHDSPANEGPWLSTAGPSLYGKNATVYGLIVSNNFVYDWSPYNDACIRLLGGATNIIVNNVISNAFGGDIFRIWGSNHIIRANIIKEHGSGIASVEGAGNAAFNGRYYFSTNLYGTYGAGGVPYTNASGYVLFDYGNTCPCGTWSNKFVLATADQSVTFASAPQQYGPWTLGPGSNTIVSAPTMAHLVFDHPDFIQSFGVYDSGQTNLTWAYEPSVGHVIEDNWVEANWNGTAGQVNSADGTNLPPTIHDWLYRNNVFIGCTTLSMDASYMRFYHNTWINCGQNPAGGCIAFAWNEPASSSPRGEAWGSEVTNNAFIVTGQSVAGQMPYAYSVVGSSGYQSTVNVTNDGYQHCDYNYVANDLSWNPKTAGTVWGQANVGKFFEPHGINGGDPKLAYLTALPNFNNHPTLDPRPMLGSPLIDAGFTAAGTTNDYDGRIRPAVTTSSDIGAFEFDPTLLMHLSFQDDFNTNGMIKDITGNGHNAKQQDPTNWIQQVGVSPRILGKWYSNGTMTDGSQTYNKTQFGAITNVNVISNLTSGTIIVYYAYDTNAVNGSAEPEMLDTIMDAGDLVAFASQPQYSTNSWTFNFGYPSSSAYGTKIKKWAISAYTDQSTLLYDWSHEDRTSNSNQFYHIAVTWAAGGNLTAYENGLPVKTNTFTMPYLQVGGSGWICLGALQHSAPTTWPNNANGHGGLPNSGWFKGWMGDIQMYNRALPAGEVSSLYAAISGGAQSGGGAPSYILTVTSLNPTSGVSITLSPTSNDNVSSGNTSFTAAYTQGTSVTATTPATVNSTNYFYQWWQNGAYFTNNVAATFTMNSTNTMEAVYTNVIGTTILLNGSSTFKGTVKIQ